MKYIEFGESKRKVSNVILGLMRIPELKVPEIGELINEALSSGINFLDIADVYTNGKAEELLGATFKEHPGMRDEVFLQTKCGICKNPHFFDFSKKHIIESVEASLKRLGTDHVDSLLLHRPDALMDPEEVGEAFSKLHQDGKVLNFGVSNMNPMQMKYLQSGLDFKLCANQVQMSVCHAYMVDSGFHVNMDTPSSVMRDGGILDYCRMEDTSVQFWSVMQHGFFKGVFIGDPAYLKLNQALDKVAEEYNVTSTAVAIAWLLRIPGKMQAVIGTTKPKRVAQSAAASDITLTRAQWYEIFLAAGNDLP